MVSAKDALASLRFVVSHEQAEHTERNLALNVAHVARLTHFFEINPPYGDASDDLEYLMRGGLTEEQAREFQSLETTFFELNGRDMGDLLELAANYTISYITNGES